MEVQENKALKFRVPGKPAEDDVGALESLFFF